MARVAKQPLIIKKNLTAVPTIKSTGRNTILIIPKDLIQMVLCYGILPNALFLVLSYFVYLMRPIFNVDYLLIGAMAPFLGTPLLALGFGVVFLNDLMLNLAPLYHFAIADLFRWLTDIQFLSWRFTLPIILGLAVSCIATTSLILKVSPPKRNRLRNSAAMVFLGFALFALDVLNGTSFILMPFVTTFTHANIAYSGIRRTAMSLIPLQNNDTFTAQPMAIQNSAVGRAFGGRQIEGNLVLIVVESMGLFQDTTLQRKLIESFYTPKLAQKYTLESGQVPFTGHTIEAEFRELCNVQLQAFGNKNLPHCLPQVLKERGYDTLAIHGFTNQFYRRFLWYPKLGFTNSLFAEDLPSVGVTARCGSGFKGICDTAIVNYLGDRLLYPPTSKPQFLYWMTLNSHLPLDSEGGKESAFDCSQNPITYADAGICLHTRMVHLLLDRVAALASDPRLKSTSFVIVGDHMPPFYDSYRRSLYSATEVPYLALKPR